MKNIFGAVLFLLIGIVIGYLLPAGTLEAPTKVTEETIAEETEVQTTGTTSTSTQQTENSEVAPIQIEASALSAEQLKLLETFGIDANGITVTKEMIVCAEGKLGKTRLNEILAGATPTFFEGASLLPCYK